MPSAIQCLHDCLGSSGFSLAHLTLRALQASQPLGRSVRYSGTQEQTGCALCDCRLVCKGSRLAWLFNVRAEREDMGADGTA